MVLAVLERRGRGPGSASATSTPRRSAACGSPSRPPTWRWRWRSPAPRRTTPLATGLVAIGEVGLAGEIRRVTGIARRLAEAARLGFTHALVPAGPRQGARRASRSSRSPTSATHCGSPSRAPRSIPFASRAALS